MKTTLIAFSFITLLATASCNPQLTAAFTMSFKTCEVQNLPPELKNLESQAINLLLNGASNDQLKQLGIKDGISLAVPLLQCIISASVVTLEQNSASGGHGEVNPRVFRAIARGKTFLKTLKEPNKSYTVTLP